MVRPDPLAAAIADGTLDTAQRQALAKVIQALADEAAGARVIRPATFLERAMVDAGRWASVQRTWQDLHLSLYRDRG
ncbi:hypothetical protein [Nocardiopsis algeriensis]|uniref:Uncharacterized membrane protein YebE (DUF533 family) n=1 Tax=Nocardiopsis algeriensis TaxID=1478215 RepID=A0A841ILP7_9ACTN|nr:hypothetical protein [Nocardiopsis algeriensis]MBB6118166.1 uncharacterized membrane protein YebE (DUF533 family) [Nocardiopsis algeriensis]